MPPCRRLPQGLRPLHAFGRHRRGGHLGPGETAGARRLHTFRLAPRWRYSPSPAAADLAGRIGAGLDRIGQPIGLADTMIAAIALEHGLELVTGNTSDFQRVQQLGYPLILTNWRMP